MAQLSACQMDNTLGRTKQPLSPRERLFSSKRSILTPEVSMDNFWKTNMLLVFWRCRIPKLTYFDVCSPATMLVAPYPPPAKRDHQGRCHQQLCHAMVSSFSGRLHDCKLPLHMKARTWPLVFCLLVASILGELAMHVEIVCE